MKITAQERWDALSVADRVKDMAATVTNPFVKARLRHVANDIIRTYGFSDQDKAATILSRVKNGCSSYRDIEEETRFSASEIRRVIDDLEVRGLVKKTKILTGKRSRPWDFIAIVEASPDFSPTEK